MSECLTGGRIRREARPGAGTVVVAGTPLRVAIRPGTGAGPPLLLANGIGLVAGLPPRPG